MKRKSVSIILISIMVFQYLNAQSNDTINFQNSKKHEIGVSLTPIIGLYSDDNSGSIIFPFYLSYKFKMATNKLRLNYSSNNYIIEGMKSGYTYSDSIHVVQSTDRNEQLYRLGIGLEHNIITQWIEWVFAADLIIGTQVIDSYLSSQSYTKLNDDTYFTSIGLGLDSELLHRNTYYNIGLAPTIGFNARLSNHFTMGILLPLNFSSNTIDYQPNLHFMLNFQF